MKNKKELLEIKNSVTAIQKSLEELYDTLTQKVKQKDNIMENQRKKDKKHQRINPNGQNLIKKIGQKEIRKELM